MPQYTVESPTYPVAVAGNYVGTITEITVVEKPSFDDPNKLIEQFEIKWATTITVEDDDGNESNEDVTLRSWATRPKGFSDKATMSKVLDACEIARPQNGQTYDTDDWVGAACQLTVTPDPKSDGRVFNKISNYLPLSKAQKRALGSKTAAEAPF